MEFAEAVLSYYFTHAAQLSAGKRFHLANRIATWNGDKRAGRLLEACRPEFVDEPVNHTTLTKGFARANTAAQRTAPHIVAYKLRKPSFDKYPSLIGLEAEMFRLRHLKQLYGIDAREVFLQRNPLDNLQKLERDLLADKPALRALSTWAVNFVYLLHRIVLKEDGGIDVTAWLRLGEHYNPDNEEELRLLAYLYTHCIIAESNFYARDLPNTTLPTYRDMLTRLEELLAPRLVQTSLDTKLEFLVCCRLAQYVSSLAPAIYDECAQSVSPKGTFIVDTHNTFAKNNGKKSFDASEHRNVLFAMSVLPR